MVHHWAIPFTPYMEDIEFQRRRPKYWTHYFWKQCVWPHYMPGQSLDMKTTQKHQLWSLLAPWRYSFHRLHVLSPSWTTYAIGGRNGHYQLHDVTYMTDTQMHYRAGLAEYKWQYYLHRCPITHKSTEIMRIGHSLRLHEIQHSLMQQSFNPERSLSGQCGKSTWTAL